MKPITQHAPAKINLYLQVTGRRGDGYHLLDSLVVFTPDIADIVTIEQNDQFSLSITGPFADGLSREDLNNNLAVRAARLYCEATGTPDDFALHLEKNIPMGAGLGGGSADAAAVIRALEEFYKTPMPLRDKHLLSLGADVPVCYHGAVCRFEGIGDIISDIPPLPALHILLVWPHHHTPTKDVFAKRDADFSARASVPDRFDSFKQFIKFLRETDNDLSAPAKALSPIIREAEHLVAQQSGCRLARMSGSGSCVFGLFESAQECVSSKAAIRAAHPTWWAQAAHTA